VVSEKSEQCDKLIYTFDEEGYKVKTTGQCELKK